jgi:predicted metal-dependent hydrolase
MQPTADRPAVRPRRVHFSYEDLPRHWFGGDPVATHVANGLHLLFPAGERFFVRSVRHYLPLFENDPEMKALIRGFAGQEAAHSKEHEKVAEILEAQGYEVADFMKRFEKWTFETLEPYIPPALRLAATAACEHYTAMLAEDAFTEEFFRTHAHEGIRSLLMWHAAEEIEHKAVAFDVLQRVNDSWALRAAGMVLASAVLAVAWSRATRMLLAQEGYDGSQVREGLRRVRDLQGRDVRRDVFLRGFLEYLRPGFHPWNNDNRELIRGFLAELEAQPA